MAKVKSLQRAVSTSRAWIKRSVTDILELLAKVEKPADFESLVKVYSDTFHERLNTYKDNQASLEAVVGLEQLDTVLCEADAFEKDYIIPVKTKLHARLASANQDNTSVSSTSSSRPEARLPKLNLPTFNGDPKGWTSFWEQFGVIVHDTDLPDISKFIYLKSSLKGEAKAVVSGLALTAANYQVACELLSDRFGRRGAIVFSHLNELLTLQTPASPDTKQLWAFYNTLCSHVRSLETLGVDGSQYGVVLTPLVLSRLPQDLRMEWARGGENHEADLEFLVDFLKSEIERRERSQPDREPEAVAAAASLFTMGKTTTKKLKKTTTKSSTKKKSRCHLCQGPHGVDRCPDLLALSSEDRFQRLVNASLCCRCLEPHNYKQCKGTCSLCSKNHHSVICWHNKNAISSTSSTVNISASPVTKNTQTVLQTLEVTVGGRRGKKKAVVLFDTGSNNSYITQSLVDQIKPDWVHDCVLAYSSFGSITTSKPTQRNVFNVDLHGYTEEISVNVVSVPTICAPVAQAPIPQSFINKLPNPNSVSVPAGDEVQIDLLIGLDMYWKVMGGYGGEVRKLGPNLMAQKSSLGWVISGVIPDISGVIPNSPSSSTPVLNLCCHLRQNTSHKGVEGSTRRDNVVKAIACERARSGVVRPIHRRRKLENVNFNLSPSASSSPEVTLAPTFTHSPTTPPYNIQTLQPTTPMFNINGGRATSTRHGRVVKLPQRLDL